MVIVKVIEHGNSLGISLPAAFRRQLGVAKGDYLQVECDGDIISIRSNNAKATTYRRSPTASGPGASYHRPSK
jgi:antitoxin component of MazEF toxin-antitoxin module